MDANCVDLKRIGRGVFGACDLRTGQGTTEMRKRKRLETDTPPIGDRLLTLREAADVLRLNTRRVRLDGVAYLDGD